MRTGALAMNMVFHRERDAVEFAQFPSLDLRLGSFLVPVLSHMVGLLEHLISDPSVPHADCVSS